MRTRSRRRKQRGRQQLVDRVKEAITDERENGQEGGSSRGIMQRQRETRVNRLLQQMMQRKQTSALQLAGGRKVAGVQKVGEELAKFWYEVMTSSDVTVPECEEFFRGLNPPKMWTEALEKLWKKPSEDFLTRLNGVGRTRSHFTARRGRSPCGDVPCVGRRVCTEDTAEDGTRGQDRTVG